MLRFYHFFIKVEAEMTCLSEYVIPIPVMADMLYNLSAGTGDPIFCDDVFLLPKHPYMLINQAIISKSPSTSPSTLLTLPSPHLTFPHRRGERDTRVFASHENNVNLSPQAWGEGHLTDQASGTGMP